MPLTMLDTDVLIDLSRKHPPALAWLETLTEYPTAAGFAALELLFGCRDRRQLNEARLLLDLFETHWPSAKELDFVKNTYPELKLSHHLGVFDALIAVTAISANSILITFNEKHFNPIPGLRTLQPYSRNI